MTPEEKRLYIANGNLTCLISLWEAYLEDTKGIRTVYLKILDTGEDERTTWKGNMEGFMGWLRT